MLRRVGKQSGESMYIYIVSPGEERECYDGKDLQKRKVLNLE